jgi:hypothetical protein
MYIYIHVMYHGDTYMAMYHLRGAVGIANANGPLPYDWQVGDLARYYHLW